MEKTMMARNTVPFERDPAFVIRKGVFDQLDTIFSPSNPYRWVALHGLGGIGKSQIAIEYAYRSQDHDPELWVLWIYANTASSIVRSFEDAVKTLELPGYDDPKTDRLILMENWLKDRKNGKWLIILDNIDDLDVVNAKYGEDRRLLIAQIPQCSHGQVLATSRDKETANAVVRDNSRLVHVDRMTKDESLALLERKVSIPPGKEAIAYQLLETLDFVPLAISQAGAYMQQDSLVSIEEYLGKYLENESNRSTLLSKIQGESQKDGDVPKSVMSVWETSFKQIRRRNPIAADVLFFISLFHRQKIPIELVITVGQEATCEVIILLEGYSFITLTQARNTATDSPEIMLNLHRLIQLACKRQLEAQGNFARWVSKALSKITEIYPRYSKFENWKECEALSLHAEQILKYPVSSKDDYLNQGLLLDKLSWHDISKGNYTSAVTKAETCDNIFHRYADEDSKMMINGKNVLASAYRLQGRWSDAEKLEVQIMKTNKAKLGPRDPGTISSMINLAMTYQYQGRWNDAETLLVQVVDIQKTDLGPDNVTTLNTIALLATTYQNQGRLIDAEQLQVHVVNTRSIKLGADHPHTLVAIANLASNYIAQGRYEYAERSLVLLVKIHKTHPNFGPTHPATSTLMANLAVAYRRQGRLHDAEQLDREVLEIRKTTLGPNHPQTLISMNSLAHTLSSASRPDEAKEIMRTVVGIQVKSLGRQHPHTIASEEALRRWTNA